MFSGQRNDSLTTNQNMAVVLLRTFTNAKGHDMVIGSIQYLASSSICINQAHCPHLTLHPFTVNDVSPSLKKRHHLAAAKKWMKRLIS